MLLRRILGGSSVLAAGVGGILALGHDPAPGGGNPGSMDTAQAGLPLTPARVARFTATEGTWISLDVSPDGRTLVFDLLGDVYTLPIAGGRATRLTQGLPYDAQPRWSPDGRRIAFVSDRTGAMAPSGSGSPRVTRMSRWFSRTAAG